MAPELALLFPVSIACDVLGQVCFKIGADRLSSDHQSGLAGGLLSNRWLLAGIAIFALETLVWLRILSLAPLSIAFPIASLNFLGVTLAGRWFFGEAVAPAQWLGCLLVTLGVAILAVTGAG